jgi:hypothetical protein
MESGTDLQIFNVFGFSPRNILAVGTFGRILHYDGENWGRVSSGTQMGLIGIWGSSVNNIFVAGDRGSILHNCVDDW